MNDSPGIAFQNRVVELEVARQIARDAEVSARIIILKSQPAAGMTSFLRHAGKVLSSEECLTVYSNSLGRGPTQIFDSFFRALESQMDQLSRRIDRPEQWRAFIGQSIGGGLTVIPGGGALKPTSEMIFDRIRTSYHSSGSAERFSQLVSSHLKDKSILFLIDNAQFLRADDLDVFRETVGQEHKNVRFILGFVDRKKAEISLEELSDRLRSTGQETLVEPFHAPDGLIAEDIMLAMGLEAQPGQAEALALENQRNVHKIVSAIRSLKDDVDQKVDVSFSPDTRALLRYLLAGEMPLPLGLLTSATHMDPAVRGMEKETVIEVLRPLVDRSIARWRTRRQVPVAVELSVDSEPLLETIRQDKIGMLTARNNLYRTLVSEPAEASVDEDYSLALRYNLSLDVDKERSHRYALALVERAIRTGSVQTAIVFADAMPDPASVDDLKAFLVTVAFRIATKQYVLALDALNKVVDSQWTADETFCIYKAICLNRTRAHAEAEELLAVLLDRASEPEVVSVLGAIRISGLVHLGRHKQAVELFKSLQERTSGASNEGYFIRNGAAAFDSETALLLLRRARIVSVDNNDGYAEVTCLANQGAVLAGLGKFEPARGLIDEAVQNFSSFGFVHMEEALCNLAYLELCAGCFEVAEHRLEDLIAYGQPNMPKLYSYNHYALLLAMQDRKNDAMKMLCQSEALAQEIAVPIAQIRHGMNTLLIRRFLGDDNVSKVDLNTIVNRYDDRNLAMAIDVRTRVLAAWDNPSRSALMNAYSPGFLEYWSFDALGLLPGRLLPRVAVGK